MPKVDGGIAGNPGTEPLPDAGAVAEQTKPAQSERTASLIDTPEGVFVQVGTARLRLDQASGAKLAARKEWPTTNAPAAENKRLDDLRPALEAAALNESSLKRVPDVIAVRAGYKFIGGKITEIPCVIVSVDRKLRDVPQNQRIPGVVDGVATDVTWADPYERMASASGSEAAPAVLQPRLLIDEIQPSVAEAGFLEALPSTTYVPPPNLDLEPVAGAMTITCHVSPDAGWKVLEPFLGATRESIVLGMYDFTAPHIYTSVRSLLRDSDVTWKQTLGPKESLPGEDDVDSSKAGDLTEKHIVTGLKRLARSRFENAFAHTGAGQTFASAYHIKVAVRDKNAFWLSSGNWQSSNQPNIDFFDADADRKLIPRYNREWHVVVENAALAKRFRAYLEYDFEVASEPVAEAEAVEVLPDLLIPFEETMFEERAAASIEVFAPETFTFTKDRPLVVQPILTPDNYLEVVLDFLKKKPSRTLFFQNQSLNPVKDPSPEFKEMMRLLARYSNEEDLDARFIFRNIGPIRKKLESLQLAGFNMSRIKTQSGCHTKGIIIDSERILLGSHNFTNQGVQVNRDASLMMSHEGIAQYYERVFLHDWDRLARTTIREEAVPRPVGPGEESYAEIDAIKVPWSTYVED
jgi:hypothetical protein